MTNVNDVDIECSLNQADEVTRALNEIGLYLNPDLTSLVDTQPVRIKFTLDGNTLRIYLLAGGLAWVLKKWNAECGQNYELAKQRLIRALKTDCMS